MNHLDLFSGLGGFSLAAQWVWGEEYQNIGFVEIDRYCQELLKLRFPGAKIYGDIKEVTKEHIIADTQGNGTQGGILKRHGESELGKDDVPIIADTKCDGLNDPTKQGSTGFSHGERRVQEPEGCPDPPGSIRVDLLTGGFPCQPFSQAGQRRGTQDDRHLWPEMLRIIDELRPRWVIGENVSGITNMAQHEGVPEMESEADNEEDCADDCGADGILWGIINDLERIGYSVQTFVIPACAVNAPHRRDRVWIVGYSESNGDTKKRKVSGEGERHQTSSHSMRSRSNAESGIVAHSESELLQWSKSERNREWKSEKETGNGNRNNESGSQPSVLQSQGCGEYDTDPDIEFLEGCKECEGRGECISNNRNEIRYKGGTTCKDDTDTAGFRPSGQGQQEPSVHPKKNTDGQTDKSLHGSQLNTRWDTNWVEAATEFCGISDGLPYRLDGFELSQSKLRIERLKSLGNSIVPQVVYQIMLAIKQIDTLLNYQDH